jgi:uncharacterized protein with PIN domain
VILDSSAVVAIFLQEPGHEEMLEKLWATETRAMGAPTVAETGIVLTSKMRRNAIGMLARFLQDCDRHCSLWRRSLERGSGRF